MFSKNYFCVFCGNPIDCVVDETHCISCIDYIESQYLNIDLMYYSIRGYVDNKVILENPSGESISVSLSEFEKLESENLVYYSMRGFSDYSKNI